MLIVYLNTQFLKKSFQQVNLLNHSSLDKQTTAFFLLLSMMFLNYYYIYCKSSVFTLKKSFILKLFGTKIAFYFSKKKKRTIYLNTQFFEKSFQQINFHDHSSLDKQTTDFFSSYRNAVLKLVLHYICHVSLHFKKNL